MDLRQGVTTASGIEFAYLEAGSGGDPLALCLHGFPDTAWGFRHLLPALAESGYRAVAPFMRGYAPTAVPPDERYGVDTLARDANELHDALGAGADAVLIGHDWGASAAYGAAGAAPQRWRRVVTMAVPPPKALGQAFVQYDQVRRSFYIFFFQLPFADFVVGANDLGFLARLWQDWSPGYDAAADLEHVRSALRSPENLAAALGYYRALFDPERPREADFDPPSAPAPPTLYLHGERDGCIGVAAGRAAAAELPAGSRVEIVENAGHFLHLEQPDVVNRLILDFVSTR